VAWFGMVGATPMRTRPSAPPVPAADGPLGQAQQPLGRRRPHRVHDTTQVGRELVGQVGHRLVEDHVGHRRGEDDAHSDVGIGTHHGLEGLVGDGRHRHIKVVGCRAAGLEHLDGADGGREVLVIRRSKSIVCDGVVQQILEGQAASAPAGQVTGRMGVGIAEAGQHDATGGVDQPCVGGRGEGRPHRLDAVALHQDVGPGQGRGRTRQDLPSADQQCHARLRCDAFVRPRPNPRTAAWPDRRGGRRS
jgi:hypothetical protein